MTRPDLIREGLARGWRVLGGPQGPWPDRLTCDVLIVGTGAGGGITADLLTAAGLDVLIVEEGPLKSASNFTGLERDAYPALYQEAAGRRTADRAIGILQGRCVGGSTTVNWTSSFRTPASTLAFWRERFGLTDLTPETLAPWFEQVERRLSIERWPVAPNANNERLRTGASKLGIATDIIARNVKGCWDLGNCGLGCPTQAKQSMLVTTLPAALDRGARLLVQCRAERIEWSPDGRVSAVVLQPVHLNGSVAGEATRVSARHVVLAGGAINTPALLMRSSAPDPYRLLGRRTFLHPVAASVALFEERIAGWSGAPQSVYSDHFLETVPVDGPIGFKLEAPPLYPVIAATTLPGIGSGYASLLRDFEHTQALLALLRDGFHASSPGGTVRLRRDGSAMLDYPLNDYLLDGVRRAWLAMAEIQFAAGASKVLSVHEGAGPWLTWDQAKRAISGLASEPSTLRLLSAHVMGGCMLAPTPERGITRPDGQHWQIGNLSIHDGSLFPTSIGANPQLSVYAVVARLAAALAARLTGRQVALA